MDSIKWVISKPYEKNVMHQEKNEKQSKWVWKMRKRSQKETETQGLSVQSSLISLRFFAAPTPSTLNCFYYEECFAYILGSRGKAN